MPEPKWKYLTNVFEIHTRNTNVKMLSLVTDTHAKLKGASSDPDILLIFNDLDPVYQSYRQVCINYDMTVGNYRGETLAFEKVMESLPTEIRKWESAIRVIYLEDSPEEKAIFPHKRTPFLQGTYEDRLSNLGSLAQKLSSDPALVSPHAMVSSFYNHALSARLTQQEKEGSVDKLASIREDQRVITAWELYRAMARLMAKYYLNIDHVERFFDLSLIRRLGEHKDETEE